MSNGAARSEAPSDTERHPSASTAPAAIETGQTTREAQAAAQLGETPTIGSLTTE